MDIIFAIIAGAVQGVTEFLPISSTSHLIILEKLFGVSPEKFGLAFDASLHLGTLLAVIIFFHKKYEDAIFNKDGLLIKLVIGTIPAVVLGVLLESQIETVFRSINVIGASLIIFSAVIFLAEKVGKKTKKEQSISFLGALVIGFAQSIALVPGVSRSGATISAGLFLGQSRQSSARFAFLLSGPVIAGAGSKKLLEVFTSQGLNGGRPELFAIGIVSSFIFGYLTIKFFLKFLETNGLYPFIVYRLILGSALLIAPLLLS